MNKLQEAKYIAQCQQNFRAAKMAFRYLYMEQSLLLVPVCVISSHKLYRKMLLKNYCKYIGKKIINSKKKLAIVGVASDISNIIAQF